MTHSRNEETLKAQVEDRPAHFFEGEEGPFEAVGQDGRLAGHPLKDLKAILLSIEWEITDETMGSLISEIGSLERVYEKDKIFYTFLQLLRSVAKYIQARGEGVQHVAFRVENIDEALAELKQKGVRLIDQAPRNGAGGARIAFIHPKETNGVLVELCERD